MTLDRTFSGALMVRFDSATCLMTEAPSTVDSRQLAELGIAPLASPDDSEEEE